MPHDRPADFAQEGIRHLPHTQLCRLEQVFHRRDQVGWGCWTPEMGSPGLCSLPAGVDALGDHDSSSSNVFASTKSAVSNPSVNQP
jgi:hypothetical protein